MSSRFAKNLKAALKEAIRRLPISPYQAAKIKRGEANLTLASFAHFLALMDKEPKDVFKA
jgi:hypothetical protein